VPSKDREATAGQVAALERWHPYDKARLAEARRDLRAEQLADHVRRVVDTFPPLTREQRSRLAALLLAPGGDGDGT
jgi:hypothetical protein